MKYTVLLLRPDYVANNYGQDTYLAYVDASTVEAAEQAAQVEARMADLPPDTRDDKDVDGSPMDYHVLFVTEGWLQDLKT